MKTRFKQVVLGFMAVLAALAILTILFQFWLETSTTAFRETKVYNNGDPILLKVHSVTSKYTPLPFDYYSLPVCSPDLLESFRTNLGQKFAGDSIKNALAQLSMNSAYPCQRTCMRSGISKQDIVQLRSLIDLKYKTQWTLDNIPANVELDNSLHIVRGVPIGTVAMNYQSGRYEYSLNNHFTFKIRIRKSGTQPGYVIVKFNIEPRSLNLLRSPENPSQQSCGNESSGSTNGRFILPDPEDVLNPDFIIPYWATVEFIEEYEGSEGDGWNEMVETSNSQDDKFHLLGLLNGLFLLAIPFVYLLLIILRITYPSIGRCCKWRCNKDAFEASEKTMHNWRKLRRDVFRPPVHKKSLAILVGLGIQLFFAIFHVLVLGSIGLFGPEQDGLPLTLLIFFLTVGGCVGGYTCMNILKFFGEEGEWIKTGLKFWGVMPIVVIVLAAIVDIVIAPTHSSGGIPISALVYALCLWVALALPFTLTGCFLGCASSTANNMVLSHDVMPVVQQHVVMRILKQAGSSVFIASVGYIEVMFMHDAIWTRRYYLGYRYALCLLVLLMLTSSLAGMLATMLQLSSGSYHWWWSSHLNVSLLSGALISILTSTRHSFDQTEAYVVYYVVHLLTALTYSLIAGAFGVLGSWWFVHRLYEFEAKLPPVEQQDITQLQDLYPRDTSMVTATSSLLNTSIEEGATSAKVIDFT